MTRFAAWFAQCDFLCHPLLVAGVQLLVGLVAAYVFTERWQRFRQLRDFQYRAMAKLSETSMGLSVLLADLLSLHPYRLTEHETWAEKQRSFISQRVVFHALEPEIKTGFRQPTILAAYYDLNNKLKILFDLVQHPGTLNKEQFEPTQQAFLDQRKALLGEMIAAMRFLGWRERRQLSRAHGAEGGRHP